MPTIESYTGDNLQITYTGTLPTPLLVKSTSRKVLVPVATGAGAQQTFFPSNQIGCDAINYTDAGALAGPGVTSLSFDNLGWVGSGGIVVNASTNITSTLATLGFPALTDAGGGITLYANGSISSIFNSFNCPVLANVCSGGFAMGNQFSNALPNLSNLSLPLLACVTGDMKLYLGIAALGFFFSAPNLKYLNGSLMLGSAGACLANGVNASALIAVGGLLSIYLHPSTTTLALPALAGMYGGGNLALGGVTNLSLTALVTSGSQLSLSGTALTTLSLPGLVTGAGLSVTAALLANVTLNQGIKKFVGNCTITGAALTAASVNGILTALAQLDGTNGTTAYSSGTVNLSGGTSAAPTGAGATAKSTLQGRGVTVTTN